MTSNNPQERFVKALIKISLLPDDQIAGAREIAFEALNWHQVTDKLSNVSETAHARWNK